MTITMVREIENRKQAVIRRREGSMRRETHQDRDRLSQLHWVGDVRFLRQNVRKG